MYAVCFIDLKEQLKCVLSPYQKGGTDVDGTLPDIWMQYRVSMKVMGQSCVYQYQLLWRRC